MTEPAYRHITLPLGIAISFIGRWLAWPGEMLGDLGVWLANLGCRCPWCQDEEQL